MNNNEEEMVAMFEDFPIGGAALDIPDTGVSDSTEVDVEALLELW